MEAECRDGYTEFAAADGATNPRRHTVRAGLTKSISLRSASKGAEHAKSAQEGT